MRSPTSAVLLITLLVPLPDAAAIITKKAPGRTLSPPTGEFAGRGWEFTGKWGGFLGTPIAPQYFVTAKHLGGAVGQKLFYQGKAYTAVESFPCPGSDLAVWRVAERFPAWAQLYTGNQEKGQAVFLTGCGTARGAPVITADGKHRGWRWGADDHRQSWGINQISGIANYSAPDSPWKNEILTFSFDRDGPPHEGIVSGSDSGGAVFLRDSDGIWKLAGIIYGVDGTPVSTAADGKNASAAALFDTRGLYQKDRQTGEMHYHDPLRPHPQPTTAGATRISSSIPFLRSIVPDLRPFPLWQTAAAVGTGTVVFFLGYLRLKRRGVPSRKRRRRRQ